MLELFQAEWCPSSARVRQRFTELGIDYVIHQVPVEREARGVLRDTVGALTIPALRLENGSAIVGAENILAHLGEHSVEVPEAEAHRQRAANARRRYLEDECECSQVDVRQSRRERAVERTRSQIQGRQGEEGAVSDEHHAANLEAGVYRVGRRRGRWLLSVRASAGHERTGRARTDPGRNPGS